MSVQTGAQLVGQIYMWAGIAVGAGVYAIVVTALWFWKNHNRTKISKTIDAVKGKPVQLLLAASLGSFAKLLRAKDFNPEGVVETMRFKDRAKGLKGIRRKTYFPPRKINVGSTTELKTVIPFPDGTPEAKKIEVAELTREMAQTMIDKTSEKVFLEGVGVPISVVVEDKVITANIKGLGAMEFYKKLEKVSFLGTKIKGLLVSENYKEVGEALQYLYSRISIVPFDLLREYFDESYDQSNEDSQKEWHYTQGYRDGVASVKKDKDQGKLFLYMGLGLGVAGLAAGIVLAFLGK
jgi:F0F1-type ATP synthase membrane subunit c/vacuolar-type H+-ATPase subunit K